MSQGSSSQHQPCPVGLPGFKPVGVFEQGARRRLEEDATRLFSSSEVDLVAVTFETTSAAVNTIVVANANDLDSLLQAGALESQRHIFVFLRPVHSWGPLRITFDGFTRLIAAFPVSPAFLHFVASFGTRIGDVDGNTGGHGRSCVYGPAPSELDSEPARRDIVSDDFSFLLRYPERHGRPSKNPWSMRQVAMHKSHDHEHNTSKWIFVHCPQNLQTELIDSLAKAQGGVIEEGEMISLDFILAGVSLKWRDYINYLESEITALNEKACYSCVEKMEQHDYIVGFSDAQALQGIRRKLLKGIEAIDQALDVICGIRKHRDELGTAGALRFVSRQEGQLDFHLARYQNHRRSLVALADLQQGASALFLKMLDQRNDRALHLQGEAMNNLAIEAKRESEFMKDLSEKMQRDSRSMRVLSSIAVVYLPASLVASVFNSNLLQPVAPGEPAGQRKHFVVTSQIWIFAVLIIALSAATMLVVWVWTKWTQVLDSKKATNSSGRP